ncbi:hypothetical protein FQA39_LY07626 [Lamprigera yunnana]|nr:hypothetical protein FQA39_LY07626 [Lamprigera yunnana]
MFRTSHGKYLRKLAFDILEKHEAVVTSAKTDAQNVPAQVVNTEHSRMIDKSGLFVQQPRETIITGDQPTTNENVEVLDYQEMESANHKESSAESNNSDFSNKSDDLYQPSSPNSNASID